MTTDVRVRELLDRYDTPTLASRRCCATTTRPTRSRSPSSRPTCPPSTSPSGKSATSPPGSLPRWHDLGVGSGRPGRHADGQVRGAADRAARDLATRRGARAAVHGVRAAGDRVPARCERGEGRRGRRLAAAETGPRRGCSGRSGMVGNRGRRRARASAVCGSDRGARNLCAESVAVAVDGLMVQLFTTGTTGTPKGVPVPAKALASFHAYLEFGLGVRDDDVFWNAADPGWAYGLYYAIIGPMAAGIRSLLLHAGLLGATTWQCDRAVRRHQLRRRPDRLPQPARRHDARRPGCDCAARRRRGSRSHPTSSPGRQRTLGVAVRDHYGQTEHGMFIVNAWHDGSRHRRAARVHGPAAAGLDLRGAGRRLRRRRPDRHARPGRDRHHRQPADVVPPATSMPRTRPPQRFTDDGRWYITGDAGMRRRRRVLLLLLPRRRRDHHGGLPDRAVRRRERAGRCTTRVVEAAVVGVPDELRGEVLEAFVVLRDGVAATTNSPPSCRSS